MICCFQDHCISSDTSIHNDVLGGEYLPYSDGLNMNIFIKKADGRYMEGEVNLLSYLILSYLLNPFYGI